MSWVYPLGENELLENLEVFDYHCPNCKSEVEVVTTGFDGKYNCEFDLYICKSCKREIRVETDEDKILPADTSYDPLSFLLF